MHPLSNVQYLSRSFKLTKHTRTSTHVDRPLVRSASHLSADCSIPWHDRKCPQYPVSYNFSHSLTFTGDAAEGVAASSPEGALGTGPTAGSAVAEGTADMRPGPLSCIQVASIGFAACLQPVAFVNGWHLLETQEEVDHPYHSRYRRLGKEHSDKPGWMIISDDVFWCEWWKIPESNSCPRLW